MNINNTVYSNEPCTNTSPNPGTSTCPLMALITNFKNTGDTILTHNCQAISISPERTIYKHECKILLNRAKPEEKDCDTSEQATVKLTSTV